MKNEKKTCENCKYFLQHYVRSYAIYHKVCCGHCTHHDLPRKERSARDCSKIYRACSLWESNEPLKAERREYITDVLYNMAQRVEDIAVILKDDME